MPNNKDPDAAEVLQGCGQAMTGCGCLIILIPMLIAFVAIVLGAIAG